MTSNDQLRIYWKNVLDTAVGPADGLKEADVLGLQGRIGQILEAIEADRKKGKLPYRDLPYREDLVQGVEAQTAVFKPGCENLVVLGIGGSALGNIALQTALRSPVYNLLDSRQRGGPRLFVVDNVDPVQFGTLLDYLDDQLDRTVFNVISKSGETAETAAQFLVIRDLLVKRLGEEKARRQIAAVTDAKSGTMRTIVDAEGYAALPVPDGVGGRFSVLSPVGLFSAAMCGINIRELLAGAADMDKRVQQKDLRKNPAGMLAAIYWLMYEKGKNLHVMMPYAYQLKDLSDWYRQLWAESLGKQKSLDGRDVYVGPTPIKALGTTDQHSQVQLYREGPNDKVITFLAVEKFDRDVPIPDAPASGQDMAYLSGASMARLINAEREATEQALVASRRPCVRIVFPRINERTVGEFIYLWEMTTSIAGQLLGINAYDQPAVQLGKEYTFALMDRRGYERKAAELREQLRTDGAYLV